MTNFNPRSQSRRAEQSRRRRSREHDASPEAYHAVLQLLGKTVCGFCRVGLPLTEAGRASRDRKREMMQPVKMRQQQALAERLARFQRAPYSRLSERPVLAERQV